MNIKRKLLQLTAVSLLCLSAFSGQVKAGADPILGEISMFAGNFAPRGWAFCNGQLLSISQNSALFSVLGTTYGGDGRTTFGLPDLRGRAPVSAGTGPGLATYRLGQRFGASEGVLMQQNLPPASAGSTTLVVTSVATEPKPVKKGTNDTVNALGAIGTANIASGGAGGHSAPFDIHQPSLAINYIIALQGIYPSRQ